MATDTNTAHEAERQRIIKLSEERGEFVTGADGFVRWWPNPEFGGHLEPYHLRWLADHLDQLNADWQQSCDQHCDGQADSN